MTSTLLDWAVRPGVGAASVGLLIWAVRRIHDSERVRTVIGRTIDAALKEAVTQVVLPPVADRLASIESTLAVFADAQRRIDATMTTHMAAEDEARRVDIEWRKRRQAEHDTRLAAIEARLSLLEATQ